MKNNIMLGENMDEYERFVVDYFYKINAQDFGIDEGVIRRVKEKLDEYYEDTEGRNVGERITTATEDWTDDMIKYEHDLSLKELKAFVNKHKSAIDELLRENGTYNDLYNELDSDNPEEQKITYEEMIHHALFEFAYQYLCEKYKTDEEE